jgi:hypothetical protein
MANFCHGRQGGTIDDLIYGRHVGKRAAGNIDDFIHMDTTGPGGTPQKKPEGTK